MSARKLAVTVGLIAALAPMIVGLSARIQVSPSATSRVAPSTSIGAGEVVDILDSVPGWEDLKNRIWRKDPTVGPEVETLMKRLQPVSTPILREALLRIFDRSVTAGKVRGGKLPESALFEHYSIPWKSYPGQDRDAYLKQVDSKCYDSVLTEIWLDRFLFEAPTKFVRTRSKPLGIYGLYRNSPNSRKLDPKGDHDVLDAAYPVVATPTGGLTIQPGSILGSYIENRPYGPAVEFDGYAKYFKRRKQWW